MAGYVASLSHDPRAVRAARATQIVLGVGLRRARRSGPLVELIGDAPARALQAAFWRSLTQFERDRARARRRRRRGRTIAAGAVAALAFDQIARLRAARRAAA